MITFGNYKDFEKKLSEIIKDMENQTETIFSKNTKNENSSDYNIYEQDGYKHYEFMLPGFEKDDIRVELNHKNEIVVTTRKLKSDVKKYIERNVSSTKMFKVQIYSELINDEIKTEFKDGILTISFKPQINPKIIKIN